jgi:hypothetical protein
MANRKPKIGPAPFFAIFFSCVAISCAPESGDASSFCPGLAQQPFRQAGLWVQPGLKQGSELLPGISLLTGTELKPLQTRFCIPEIADPYISMTKNSVILSGTAQYYLAFHSMEALENAGPYQIIWNDYYYSDGTPMEGDRLYAHSWDMKPSLWSSSASSPPRLWDPSRDIDPPLTVWYGGHMRRPAGAAATRWPEDNFSRDVFAFTEREPGKWFSQEESIFNNRGTWPRATGNYLGHRYGHQIVGRDGQPPLVFYEEVTDVTSNGSPAVTKIFMDEMISPLVARGNPIELISPFNSTTGKPYPSTVREDGSVLVEGPLYFRFEFEGDEWEAIGFSAGSFYSRYPAVFASRKVADGIAGKPFQIDLNDDGSDFHDAGAKLGDFLRLTGGPGRPSVIVNANGLAIRNSHGDLRLLTHAYRKDIMQDGHYRLDQMFRVVIEASLRVLKKTNGSLRFDIALPESEPIVKPFSKKWF